MKLLIAILIGLFIFGIPNVSADSLTEQSLGSLKYNSNSSLVQTCDNCTYINLTNILKPNKAVERVGVLMQKNGKYYNYTYTATQIGDYYITSCGDLNGVEMCGTYLVVSTASGYNNQIAFYFLLIGIIYSIAFWGFFGKNITVAILGGFAMILLGLFTLTNGIDIYTSSITVAFSIITIGIGTTFAITAAYELVSDNL